MFLAVCAEDSFAQAARKLFLSAPAISFRIQALEQRIGLTLFARSRRGVRVTHAGAVLRDGVRRALAQLEASIEEAQAAERGTTTQVTLWLPEIVAPLLPGTVTKFPRRQPHVEMVIHSEIPGDEVLNRLGMGTLDAAIIANEELPRLNGYECTPILHDVIGLVFAPEHPLAHRTVLTAEDLGPYRLLFFGDTSLPAWQRVKHAFMGSPLRMSETLRVGSMEGLKALLKEGVGLSFLPQVAILEDLARGELAFRPIVLGPHRDRSLDVIMWFCFSDRHTLGLELAELREVVRECAAPVQARLDTLLAQAPGRLVRDPGALSETG